MAETFPKQGGPAFACAAENGHQPGMSLRDYFAGQALVGYLAMHAGPEVSAPMDESAAKRAYMIADAMLAVREVDRG